MPPKVPKLARPSLGWREWVALPGLSVIAVKAKVDTGARSSSLHAEDIEIFESDGRKVVRFSLGGGKRTGKLREASEGQRIEVPLHELRWITSSNGTRQKRPVIRTELSLGGQMWLVDISLSPRGAMGFPMLVGREAIRGRFVVDPGRSYRAKEHIPEKSAAARQVSAARK